MAVYSFHLKQEKIGFKNLPIGVNFSFLAHLLVRSTSVIARRGEVFRLKFTGVTIDIILFFYEKDLRQGHTDTCHTPAGPSTLRKQSWQHRWRPAFAKVS